MKICIKILIIMLIMVLIPVTVNAFSWDSISSSAKDFIAKGQDKGGDLIPSDDLEGIFIPIARTLVSIASIILLGVTLVMGIKYMISSPDDQAKLKQQLVGLVVSVFVIYGARGIWALVYNFMLDIT